MRLQLSIFSLIPPYLPSTRNRHRINSCFFSLSDFDRPLSVRCRLRSTVRWEWRPPQPAQHARPQHPEGFRLKSVGFRPRRDKGVSGSHAFSFLTDASLGRLHSSPLPPPPSLQLSSFAVLGLGADARVLHTDDLGARARSNKGYTTCDLRQAGSARTHTRTHANTKAAFSSVCVCVLRSGRCFR